MTLDDLDQIVTQSIKNSTNRLQLWTYLLKNIGPKNVCEVGVWKGDYARHILDNVNTIEKYYFVDPWQNLPSWNKPANVSNSQFEHIRHEALDKNQMHRLKITELRMTTKEAAKRLQHANLDFSYIDGDHTLRGITIDLNVIYSQTNANGFIGGDDFTKNIWQHSDRYDPTEVFPYAVYFAEAQNCTIFTLPYNQFLIFKNDSFNVIDYGGYSKLTTKQIYSQRKIYQITNKLMPQSLKKAAKKLLG